MTGAFQRAYEESIRSPETFWARAAERIHWFKPYDKVLDRAQSPLPRWFTGGELNTCYNAIDRHAEGGRADQPAVIYDSPVTGSKRTFTYRQLKDEVASGEVFWAASDFGWTVGHSYIVYGPLLHGCTTIVHEGKPVGTPDPGEFWRVIEEHKVRVLFTAPTAFRAIKKEDPNGDYLKKHDLSGFRTLFLAGERLDPDTYHWARALLQKPVIDHWWQTETGWPVAANCMGLEPLLTKPGSPTKPVPGWYVEILGDDGRPLPPEKEGAVVIRLPLPPGSVPTLWQDDERFKDVYLLRFPGYYTTGDGGYFDEDGYLYIMGRIDDVIIVAGHNLSTGAMEQAIASHKDVAECAVFGVKDALKTQLPLGLVAIVREQVGPVANFKIAGIVPRLPKTRSGKVLRGTMRQIADGEPYKVPSTIDDPAILDEVKAVLRDLGYAREPRGEIGG